MVYINEKHQNTAIRFIASNHDRYNTIETFKEMIDKFNITIEEFDTDFEEWYCTNNWWDDKQFTDVLEYYKISYGKIRLK